LDGKQMPIEYISPNKISVKNYSSGTYLLNIQTDAGQISKQFVKQ